MLTNIMKASLSSSMGTFNSTILPFNNFSSSIPSNLLSINDSGVIKPSISQDQSSTIENEIFLSSYLSWFSKIQYQKSTINLLNINKTFELESATASFLLTLSSTTSPFTNLISTPTSSMSDIDHIGIVVNDIIDKNCTSNHVHLYDEARKDYAPLLHLLNSLNYVIIIIGILFNILNLIVLFNSKLNESPYSYLTILAFSDLGALSMVAIEKMRQLFEETVFIKNLHIYIITTMINIFLSCSMYVTLALTIERFIFVHSPFKAMTICRRSIARRVCLIVFIFSVVRYIYLPFMYDPNCSKGFNQKQIKLLDLYEFLISLAIPYIIILIANISLICSLNKQNSLMSVPISPNNTLSFNLTTQTSQIGTLRTGRMSSLRMKRSSTLNSNDQYLPMLEDEELQLNSPKTPVKTNIPTLNRNMSTNSTSPDDVFTNSPISNRVLKQSNTLNSISSQTNSIASFMSRASNTNTNRNKNSLNLKIGSNGTASKSSTLYHKTSNLREIRNQKKLTTTLIIILCLLLICYSPSFVFEESLANAIFGDHDNPTDEESIRAFKIKAIGYRISILLIYLNCSCNFLIYCFCNKKFKNSLKILVKKSRMYRMLQHYGLTKCSLSKCLTYFKKNNINPRVLNRSVNHDVNGQQSEREAADRLNRLPRIQHQQKRIKDQTEIQLKNIITGANTLPKKTNPPTSRTTSVATANSSLRISEKNFVI